MSKLRLTLAAGALALAAATTAFAQPAPTQPASPGDEPATTDQMAPPAQGAEARPTPMNGAPQGPAMSPPASDAQAAPATAAGLNSSATAPAPDGIQTIQQGSNTLVTNGPVPDTAANRARYGGPMSMTGKRTKPAGN